MGDDASSDSTSKMVGAVRATSQQLLRSCSKLAESLPMSEPQFQHWVRREQARIAAQVLAPEQDKEAKAAIAGASYEGYLNNAAASIEWPRLLGNFKGIAGQLADLGNTAEGAELKHVVAIPTDPVPQPDGMPSMFVPELLRTKRPPEQEAQDDKVRKKIKPALDEIPKDGRGNPIDKDAAAGVTSMRTKLFKFNSGVDDVLKAVLGSKVRGDFRRKCDATVTEFAVRGNIKRRQ